MFYPFLFRYLFPIYCHVSQCTKDKEETLLSLVFREMLRYSCERKCTFCKQSKFAYFMKVNISDVFANTPWGTVSKAVVCLRELLLPTATSESEISDATCWLSDFCV